MTTINKILIGVDDSKYATHAAEYGFSIARKFDAAIGLVNIIEPAIMPQTSPVNDPVFGTPSQGLGIEELELIDIQNTQSENIINHIIEKYAEGMEVTHFNEYGPTADGILTCSKEFKADLIVIGTHQRRGFDRLLSGSVAEDVVRHSEIPVLVVPFSA